MWTTEGMLGKEEVKKDLLFLFLSKKPKRVILFYEQNEPSLATQKNLFSTRYLSTIFLKLKISLSQSITDVVKALDPFLAAKGTYHM